MDAQVLAESERTPLLEPPHPTSSALEGAKSNPSPSTASEVWQLFKFAVPTYITMLLEASLFSTTVVVVGRLGTKELAASSLASLTSNLLGMVVTQGMATALDTLCSQAWTAAPKTTSLHALRTACLLTLFIVPQTALLWHSEKLLLLMRQDPEVAKMAGTYLRVMIFGLPAGAYFECLRRWLQAQGLMHVPTIITIIVAPTNVLLNYLLVWNPTFHLKDQFTGAPVAAAISLHMLFWFTLIYVYFFVDRRGWGGFTPEVLKGWGPCFFLGLSGIAMVGSEVWALDAMALMASYLGPTALAANSVLGTTQYILYLPSMAISVAASVRLGNLLGADLPVQARRVARISLALGFLCGLVNMVFLVVNRGWVGRIFSQEKDVLLLVKQILPVVAFYQLTDSTAGVGFGIMRGAGQAPYAALITFISYWFVSLPLAPILMFKLHLGLVGVWYAMAIGLFGIAIGLSTYIYGFLNFEKEAEKAQARAKADLDASTTADAAREEGA